jgi:hypothetical protein
LVLIGIALAERIPVDTFTILDVAVRNRIRWPSMIPAIAVTMEVVLLSHMGAAVTAPVVDMVFVTHLAIATEMPLKIALATGIHHLTKMGIPTPIPMEIIVIPIASTALAIVAEMQQQISLVSVEEAREEALWRVIVPAMCQEHVTMRIVVLGEEMGIYRMAVVLFPTCLVIVGAGQLI